MTHPRPTLLSLAPLLLASAIAPALALAGDSAADDDDSAVPAVAVAPPAAGVPANRVACTDSETIDGVVADAFVFAGNLAVTGRVQDQLFAFVGDAEISGVVGGDAYVMAGDVEVTGSIGGDLYVLGGEVVLAAGSSVGGAVYASAGEVVLDGSVGGSVQAAAGELSIGGPVGGSVDAKLGSLTLGAGASIGGDLVYVAGEQAEVPAGVSIGGETRFTLGEAGHDGIEVNIDMDDHDGGDGIGVMGRIFAMLSGLVLGAALLGLGGGPVRRAVALAGERPAFHLGLGLALALVVPVAALVLAVLIVPLPLSAIAMLGLSALALAGRVVTATALGHWLLERAGRPAGSPYAALAAGLAVIVLLAWIPVLGFFVTLAAVLVGMGALFGALREARVATPPAA